MMLAAERAAERAAGRARTGAEPAQAPPGREGEIGAAERDGDAAAGAAGAGALPAGAHLVAPVHRVRAVGRGPPCRGAPRSGHLASPEMPRAESSRRPARARSRRPGGGWHAAPEAAQPDVAARVVLRGTPQAGWLLRDRR